MTKLKRSGKRGLALVLTLTMCLSLMQITAFADPAEDRPIQLTVGETWDLSAEVSGLEGSWTSSDPQVLTVDGGVVTAEGPGTAEVTFSVTKQTLGPAPVVPEVPVVP